jgi:tetratricopeptide (TPR) repeat protein
MADNPQFEPDSSNAKAAGRALIWLLLVVAAIGLAGFPFYRQRLRSSVPSAEAADQSPGTITSRVDTVQIPTRLAYHTNGTVTVRFQGQAGNAYRIDYADTKTATPEAMQWQVAANGVVATNGWTEWLDAGETNRSAPGEVYERYYRVVLEIGSNATTISATEEIGTEESTATLAGSVTVSDDQATQTMGTGGTGLPKPTPEQELQAYATLGKLVAGGPAKEDALKQTLATSNLHSRDLMELAKTLFRTGYRRSAQLIFEAIVQGHARGISAGRLARSHLWLAKIHEDQAQEWKYLRRDFEQAKPEYQAAVANYLAAKDASRDWVRAAGWMGAAACYRELGDQQQRREHLERAINEPHIGPEHQDLATYLLATSYYEEKRWEEAAQVYQGMQQRLMTRLSRNAEEYPGQANYLAVMNTGLEWCAARQAEAQAKGQVAQ